MKKDSFCQVCKMTEEAALHVHHIIPQCDSRCTNKPNNLVTVCASCHSMIHKSKIIVEGWYLTTAGMKFFWHKAGEPHFIRVGHIFKSDGTVDIL